MFFSWDKVYMSRDITEFFAVCNFLESEGLKIKTKTVDPLSDRILTERLLGINDRPVMYFGNDRTNQREYHIFVKTEDASLAYRAIDKFRRPQRE